MLYKRKINVENGTQCFFFLNLIWHTCVQCWHQITNNLDYCHVDGTYENNVFSARFGHFRRTTPGKM